MRSGMHNLLCLLRGQFEECAASSEAEWMETLDLAEEENVAPWTARCMRRSGLALSPQVTARLAETERKSEFEAFVWASTLRSTLAAFHDRGIDVISLKGPWLAERLYGDTALRSYSDLDLLVRKDDIAAAEAVLQSIGFLPAGRWRDHERPWRRDDLVIELHQDFEHPLAFDFGIAAVWDRARPALFQATPAWLLDPADELLFLCLHGARHRYERLSHVLDLTFAFRSLPVPELARFPRRSAAEGIFALGTRMTLHLEPEIILPAAVSRNAGSRGPVEEIADQLWHEWLEQPAPILNWRMKHRFFVTIEKGRLGRASARLRHLRILLTRVIDLDFAFAGRFHLHRFWQVWLLRPVRILMDSIRASPASS